MAIDHVLHLGEGIEADEVHALVCATVGMRPDLDDGRLGFAGDSLSGVVATPDDVVQAVLSEDLAWSVRTTVWFRLDKFALPAAEDAMVACVASVLDGCTSDLVLRYHHDSVALSRWAGVVTIHDHVGLWTPDRRAAIGAVPSGPGT